MSDTITKYNEMQEFYFDETFGTEPKSKLSSTFTPTQVVAVLNNIILNYDLSEEHEKDLEEVKKYVRKSWLN